MINELAEQIDGVVRVQCEQCGSFSDRERTTAFFCNDKCRMKYHSEQRRRARQIRQALQSCATLIENMPLKGDSDEWDALEEMKGMIEFAMWKVES